MSEFFAPPLSKLGESGIGVTPAPAAGMGLALDPNGMVPGLALIERWHEIGAPGEPAFAGTWVNFGASDESAAFCKDAAGIVYLKGFIKSGTINTAAFTLPEGYRPALALNLPTVSNGAFGVVVVSAAGVVTPAVGNNASVALNLSFRRATTG